MIFTMESFRKPPYEHGVTSMEDFFEDQHNRRRFLRKYSPKLFRRLKKCKSEFCTNYHDNLHSFCSDACRAHHEVYGECDQAEKNKESCAKCVYSRTHLSQFRCYKLRCINEEHNEIFTDAEMVNPDDWCFNFQPETQRMK